MKWKPSRSLTKSDLILLLKSSIDVEEQSLYQLSVEIRVRMDLIKTIPAMLFNYKQRRRAVMQDKKRLKELKSAGK
jgi:hypothetical protein